MCDIATIKASPTIKRNIFNLRLRQGDRREREVGHQAVLAAVGEEALQR
jgi:hypothetical protein